MIALTDTSGTFIEYYEYDVFGQPTIWDASAMEIIESSAVGNPYMFTGRRYDDETGLYYYRARYYNTEIGRFLQADPIGYYYSMNLYEYCGNDPINYMDPYGLLERGTFSRHTVAKGSIKGRLDKELRPGKPGPGRDLKKGDTKRAAEAIADEMTGKEFKKMLKEKDPSKNMESLKKIKDRVEDKLEGGEGDPEAEKEREKDDPGYKPEEGDKEIFDRIKDALDKKAKEEDKGKKS